MANEETCPQEYLDLLFNQNEGILATEGFYADGFKDVKLEVSFCLLIIPVTFASTFGKFAQIFQSDLGKFSVFEMKEIVLSIESWNFKIVLYFGRMGSKLHYIECSGSAVTEINSASQSAKMYLSIFDAHF